MFFKRFLNKNDRIEKEAEIKRFKESNNRLKAKIEWIEKILAETKLEDFSRNIKEIKKKAKEIDKGMRDLEKNESVSLAGVVRDERMMKKIKKGVDDLFAEIKKAEKIFLK